VPHLLVPDNTKVAVIKACLYEPQVNRNLCRDGNPLRYGDLAGQAAPAARQGEVKVAVLIIERYRQLR
jgi:hypothetical protein